MALTWSLSWQVLSASCAFKAANVQRLTALGDVGEQNLYERVLPVECPAALIFARYDPLDGRQVALAKCVVLIAKKAVPAFQRPVRVDPIIHYAPADKCHNLLTAVPTVKEQAVTVVGAIIYFKPRELRDGRSALVSPTVYAFRKKANLRFWSLDHLCIWAY
jgi:hypothetical protein